MKNKGSTRSAILEKLIKNSKIMMYFVKSYIILYFTYTCHQMSTIKFWAHSMHFDENYAQKIGRWYNFDRYCIFHIDCFTQ